MARATKETIERARKLFHREGEVEIDDNAEESRPELSEGGTYVQAWVWVPDSEDQCRVCGAVYADGGDGFDGMCPSCADKAEGTR